MSKSMIDEAKVELEAAQLTLDEALRAWDASVSELWRTPCTLFVFGVLAVRNTASACSRSSALLSLRRGCFGGWDDRSC
jgi:hypothetical protein